MKDKKPVPALTKSSTTRTTLTTKITKTFTENLGFLFNFAHFVNCWNLKQNIDVKIYNKSITYIYVYDKVSDVVESWVQWRSYFKSGSRVSKKVFWTFSYLYLWHKMWFHAEKLLITLKFWKSLNSLYKSGSRPQKSPKKRLAQSRFLKLLNRYGI